MTNTKTEQKKKNGNDIMILPMASIEKALEVNTKTLLHYEKEDIVKPLVKEGNKRYYSLNDLGKARLTRFLTKNKIMNLTEIKILISDLGKTEIEPVDYFDYVKKHLKSIKKAIKQKVI